MLSDDVTRIELEARKRALEEYKLRCQDLRSENEGLKTEKDQRELDALQVTGEKRLPDGLGMEEALIRLVAARVARGCPCTSTVPPAHCSSVASSRLLLCRSSAS
jgi:hypothetical protein